MSDIFLIPPSFPCEFCGTKIEVIQPVTDKFKEFVCSGCGMSQRMTYYGRYFGLIKDVKDDYS